MKKVLATCLALLLALTSFGCGGSASTDKNVEWGRADAKEIDVNSKVAGRVVELLVKEGDEVKAGQVIARIDKRDLEAQRAQYEANIEAIQAQQVQARFALGQEITLVGRDGETKVTGTITDISKKAEFATQRATSERGDATDIVSFNVKIQIDSPLLRPGMRFRLDGDA